MRDGLTRCRLHPVTGPIWVHGAEPGDTLVIDVEDIAVADWGWTANLPGFGNLHRSEIVDRPNVVVSIHLPPDVIRD